MLSSPFEQYSGTIGAGHRRRVCVIGAGLTGLAAAFQLARAGHEVLVLESMLEAGGLVSSFQLGNEKIEYIYHHAFTSDRHLIKLAGELGLEKCISWHSVRESIYAGNNTYSFSTPVDLLRFREIPFWQRIKTGLTVLRAGRMKKWQDLEQQKASEWLRRCGGEAAYNRLWQPLLRSKFDSDAENISAVWIWNKFKLRGSSRSGSVKKSCLGYMKGGFSTLIKALQKSITARGGEILFGHTAMNIRRDRQDEASAYTISCILDNCTTRHIKADAVIATVSCRQFANIATGLALPDSYMQKLRSIRYKADLCLIMRLKHSLSPYYWTTICDSLPFVVVVEHTNLTGAGAYGGSVVYLSRYLDVGDSLWIQSDGEIFRFFSNALAVMYPGFDPSSVIDWRLRRTRYAQPVIECDYTRRMPQIDTPDHGVKLAGMAQIYPEDRGMNYAIRLGAQAADKVRLYLEEGPDEQ